MDADTILAAEGSARLLAALIPAQAAAHQHEANLPGYVRESIDNRVAWALSMVEGYAVKFEGH